MLVYSEGSSYDFVQIRDFRLNPTCTHHNIDFFIPRLMKNKNKKG